MDNWIVTVVCAVLGSSALTSIVQALISALRKRLSKKSSVEDHLEAIDAKINKLDQKSDAQYLSLLRLTVMSDEMPITERLIAGREYVRRGGNGDVKQFVHALEAQCQKGYAHEAD